MGRKPVNIQKALRTKPVAEQGPPKAHRLEGAVENRGLRAVKKKPKHTK